ncbi:unnamed protein product [Cylindrotheca closterium]|uniref:Uncharacterized protein n=1 Tax=Cylindrotheca closterium TaxID=2856 RepID=A0AAD2G7C6_9STRA|nr:unnamed protein product [Cylindrotheca closterium]
MHKAASTSILLTLAATALLCPADNFQQVQAFPISSASSLHRPLHHSMQLHSSPVDELELSPELESKWNQKNASRKKFGLNPMSLSEFMEVEAQVAQMSQQQELNLAAQQQTERQQRQQQQQQPSFMKNFAKGLLEDTCNSSFDCESPKVCCDLGFKKMCCSNGMLEVSLEYAMVPVPVDMRE